MDLNIKGKTAIVTGASRGIGREIAAQLAQEGVRPLLVARDAGALAESARIIADAHGIEAPVFAADLTRREAAGEAVAAALKAFGGVDILVNCAGATKRGDFFALTDDDWADGYELKFHGCVRMCRAAWPHLEKRSGAIVNIAGIGALTPSADFSIGGSVNAALINFSKAIADLGARRGVRVNTINPGYIETERLTRRIDAAVAEGKTAESFIAEMQKGYGIRRFGKVDEVGRLVAFLVSPASEYIHGATINIDGGATRGI